MFFQAFTSNGDSPLPAPLTYTVEYQASQALVGGDLSFIQQKMKEDRLPEALFWEVEFFGSIPRKRRERVLHYFNSHANSLYDVAQRLINEPENMKLRDDILEPIVPLEEYY
jgi:hypothetical protein